MNEGGPPDTGDGANLFSSRGRACAWQGAFGQFKQIQILGCNIFAEVAGAHTKSLSIDLVEQLGF